MCILFVCFGVLDEFPLLIADNRDEDTPRETLPLHSWDDHPDIVGGRDCLRRGTWLGFNRRTHRLVILTNYRVLKQEEGKKSRGSLVVDLLESDKMIEDFFRDNEGLETGQYPGLNIVVGDLQTLKDSNSPDELWYFGNRCSSRPPLQRLERGRIYGLSNDVLDSPWPKVLLGKQLFSEFVERKRREERKNVEDVGDGEEKGQEERKRELVEEAFAVMRNKTRFSHEELAAADDPFAGMERGLFLSSIFVDYHKQLYATRTSSIFLLSSPLSSSPSKRQTFSLLLEERTFEDHDGLVFSTISLNFPL